MGNEPQAYELLDHTSEIGFRATGNSLEAAFANAGKALFELMTDVDDLRPEQSVDLRVESENLEALLFDFVDELNYVAQVDGVLLCAFDLTIDEADNGYVLTGTGRGEPIRDGLRLQEVKAPTYSDMDIQEEDGAWTLEMYLDI